MKLLQYILLSTFLFFFGIENLNAQNFSGADKRFNNLQYSEAIPIYQKGLKKDSTNTKAWIKLADCYRLTNQPNLAEKCYAMAMKDPQTPTINKLYYAQTLLTNGNDEEAKVWFSEYYLENPNNEHAKAFVDFIMNKHKLVQDSNRFVITKLNINTQNAEFGAVKFKEGIIFASSRLKNDTKKDKIDPWTGKPFISMYYAKGKDDIFSEPELFSPLAKLNSNTGPVSIHPYGNEIFFTGNNSDEALVTDENLKTEKLSIYSVKIEDGKFGEPIPFQFNNTEYSVAHPFLNTDGSILYFASDMPGGFGGMDLWVCQKVDDRWTTPENLGKVVNTTGNEVYPTIGDDGTIYFSSSGLPGIGGLDIFATYFTGDGYAIPSNMCAPINSQDDDFSLCFDIKTNSGYLSSNRVHQNVNDDVLHIKSNLIPLMGIIVDKLTKEPCIGCTVYINKDGENIGVLKTDMNGRFKASLIPDKLYQFISKNKEYVNDTMNYTASKSNMTGDSLSLNIQLENTYAPNNVLVWNNILYDLNKSNIREDAAKELDRLFDLMNKNEKLKIELSAHTDCRASDSYNMTLSEKRAASAVNYLIDKGIKSERLVAKGYGETKPINNCDCTINNGSAFTEIEHQQNRRTEIKILEQIDDFSSRE